MEAWQSTQEDLQHSSGRRPRRQPDPVRPLQHRLRRRVQPGHAHRRARRAGRPVRPRGRAARRGRRRRRAQAQPRLQPDPRVRARLAGSRPRRPPTTSSRRAAPASRRRSRSPTRSRSARSTSASPAAPTPPPTPRSPSARSCARCCSRSTRARDRQGRLAALGRDPRPATSGSTIPQNGEPRTGLSMGEHAALTALEWQISREEQDELAARSHQQLAAAYDARLPRRPGHAVPRPRARPEPARRLLASRSSPRSSRSSARARPRR